MKRIFEYREKGGFENKSIKLLLRTYYGMSAALIKTLKDHPDGITVNGTHETVLYNMQKGDLLRLVMYDEPTGNVDAVKLDFGIAYEDEDIIIVNKPPYMPTHPSSGNYRNTLANALMYYWNGEGVFRAVNRLDKNTSGLMCVAKNAYAQTRLIEELKNGELRRSYTAIVFGRTDAEGTINVPIARSEGSIISRCAADSGAEAVTHYRAIRYFGNYTLLHITPETGRTHQIRVHMSYIGHPIIGDFLYGPHDAPDSGTSDGPSPKDSSGFPRQALHSCKIELIHPVTRKKIVREELLYPDMRIFLEKNIEK